MPFIKFSYSARLTPRSGSLIGFVSLAGSPLHLAGRRRCSYVIHWSASRDEVDLCPRELVLSARLGAASSFVVGRRGLLPWPSCPSYLIRWVLWYKIRSNGSLCIHTTSPCLDLQLNGQLLIALDLSEHLCGVITITIHHFNESRRTASALIVRHADVTVSFRQTEWPTSYLDMALTVPCGRKGTG